VAIAEASAEIVHSDLPVVMADPVQLSQVFQNLISNAIKFRREGVSPRIEINARQDDAGLIFSVKDNGIGFDMAHRERVFTMFKRLHTRTRYAGTGIGLSVCKKFVERHGGKIWVESQPGEGTTFFFTLPATEGESAGMSC
jgi:light-regulated signal transduction histidine kinase (bacteriophytochrome)